MHDENLFYLLCFVYATSWTLAAHSSVKTLPRLVFLTVLLTLPYFVFRTFEVILVGALVTAIIAGLIVVFPRFALFGILWGIYAPFRKFVRLLKNLPLILCGFILLLALLYVPHILYSGIQTADHHDRDIGMHLVLTLIGFGLFRLAVIGFRKTGHDEVHSSALMAGFPAAHFPALERWGR